MSESPEAQESILTRRQDVHTDIMLSEVILDVNPSCAEKVGLVFIELRNM